MVDPDQRHSNGHWKKGVSGNPNGKPSDAGYVRLLKDTFGENLEGIHYLRLALVGGKEPRFSEIKKFVNVIQNPLVKKNFRKFLKTTGLDQAGAGVRGKFSSIKVTDILSILDKMEERVFGKVTQTVQTENINHNSDNTLKIQFKKADKEAPTLEEEAIRLAEIEQLKKENENLRKLLEQMNIGVSDE